MINYSYMEIQQPQQLTKQERRELRRQEKMKENQQRKLKRFYRHAIFWSLIILVIGGSIFGMVRLASRSPQGVGPAITVDTLNTEDWVKGNRDAKIVLIEYSDFQCPACAFYHPILKKISEEFGDKIAITYRHFPLPIHQNAKPAAYASEAAGKQGKFWEMHDLIFDNQKEWKDSRKPQEIFMSFAQTLELDTEQFKNDFASKEIKTKIDNAYQASLRLGLNSTPTFFLNGKKIINPRTYEDFRNVIIQAINENP